MNYKFTKNWFNQSEIKHLLLNFLNPYQQNNILEIGCFEGMSSVFFADNFLIHNNSSLICVDPFLNIENNDHKEYMTNSNTEDYFDYNISICKNKDKIKIYKITSDDFFLNNSSSSLKFNFIYIDGCHLPDFISKDMENSFNVLNKDGIMWMDDYGGGDGIQIRNSMNNFLKKYIGQYEIIHCGYQLAIKKI